MPDHPKQPVIVLLTSHSVTMAGVALVTVAGFSWLLCAAGGCVATLNG